VGLSESELRRALERVGLGMIGQTHDVAPADKKLYALRDVTATVESIPLITASILSKKLAEGIDALVLDVKCGAGAFMHRRKDAWALAESLVKVGKANGLPTEALLTSMDAPLGNAVGNALEVVESIETLKGNGPKELEGLSVRRMLVLAGLAANEPEADRCVRAALVSGAGLEKFRRMVEQQGGDPRVVDDYSLLPSAPKRHVVSAHGAGFLVALRADKVGVGAMRLGAGRNRADDAIDPAVGVLVRAHVGDLVRPGDPVLEVHYRDDARLKDALPFLERAAEIGPDPPTSTMILWGEVTG
jgi:pyrimidine-nucleoside phosphorylase